MKVRIRITREARARGLTAADVARRLGWYRSNLSAIDAGVRAVSLGRLFRVAECLGCSPGDLLEPVPEHDRPLFRQAGFDEALRQRDLRALDGAEKSWVHAAQFAWRRHYRTAKRG